MANADALVMNAEKCREACLRGDLAAVGACMSAYWEQKKLMAHGCEPAFVRRMMDVMAPHVYGQSMAGAGGGGFMFALSKEPHAASRYVTSDCSDSSSPDFTLFYSAWPISEQNSIAVITTRRSFTAALMCIG